MTCDNVQNDQKKESKLPAKSSEEIRRNKICVYLICPYQILREGRETLTLKAVTMIDPVIGWF